MIVKKYECFSLIEAMISIFLITTGLLVSLSLLVSSFRESMDSRNQVVAILLSQEGLELVRNIRDNNWADNIVFPGIVSFDGSNFPNSDMDCRIDIYSANVKDCSSSYLLYLDGGFYSHYNFGSATKFQRKIEVDYNTVNRSDADTVKVRSIVSWGGVFPGNLSDCNSFNECVYNEVILSRWGE